MRPVSPFSGTAWGGSWCRRWLGVALVLAPTLACGCNVPAKRGTPYPRLNTDGLLDRKSTRLNSSHT